MSSTFALTSLPVLRYILRTRCRSSAFSLNCSARIWPAPEQRGGRVGHAFVGVDEVGGARIQIGAGFVLAQDFVGQRAEALLAGLGGERLLLRPERQIQIFEPLDAIGPLDLLAQLVGECVLRFDRSQDRVLALFQLAELGDARADAADLLFVEPARLVAAIARDERHRVAVVQQRDRARDRLLFDAELTRQAGVVDRSRRCHETSRFRGREACAHTACNGARQAHWDQREGPAIVNTAYSGRALRAGTKVVTRRPLRQTSEIVVVRCKLSSFAYAAVR